MTQVLHSPYFAPNGKPAQPAPTSPTPPKLEPGREEAAARQPAAPEREPLARVLVRQQDRLVVVRLAEVDWIESAGNYVRLHAGGAAHVIRQTLGGLAARLDPRRFVQVHRTAVVNLDSIRELYDVGGRHALRLVDGSELPVSRRYRRRLLAMVAQA
jgi:DNA-binding LytR/AlgR family response regulator